MFTTLVRLVCFLSAGSHRRGAPAAQSAAAPIRRLCCLLLIAAMPALAAPQPADEKFPSGPLELIVPFGPGGGADTAARTLARLLEPILGVPVNVANALGASGNVGLTRLLASPPDGHTLAMLGAIPVAAWASGVVPYQPNDFTILTVVQDSPSMLFVPLASPYQTFQQFLDHARANPGKLRVATSGYGTQDDITLRQLAALGYKTVNVPYAKPKERYLSPLQGRTDAIYEEPGDMAQYVSARQLRPLVVFGAQRHPAFPEVPTAKELGVDIGTLSNFRAIAVAPGTPMDRASKLVAALDRALESPEWKRYCAQTHTCTRRYTPQEAQAEVSRFYQTVSTYLRQLPEKMR